ncbi:MAG: hypothetical protein ABL986_18750 [Vicinamibacterales bacterium]
MTARRLALRLVGLALGATCLTACAARQFTPPSDPGSPLPAFNDVHAAVVSACLGLRTFTAELGLSGRVGPERLRGRVVAGFMRPDSMRLEGVAPLGPPAFILVSRAGVSTLVLPRENAVLREAPPADVLEALTGVALEPSDLQAVLTGCVTANPRVTSGRLHGNGWASLTMDTGAELYLQRDGEMWRLRAARRGRWMIEYPLWQGRFPSTVRLRSDAPGVQVDLSATISQLEANVDLDAAAFALMAPPGATSVSLDDLRQGGPLRNQP